MTSHMLKYEMMSQDESERVICWNMKYAAARVKGNESWLNMTRLALSEKRAQKGMSAYEQSKKR